MKYRSCLYLLRILIIISLLFLTALACAESSKTSSAVLCQKKLSLEEFRALALNQSPLLKEIDRDYARDLARAFETEVLGNPELHAEHSLTQMELNGDDDAQTQVSIGQPIRISDFGARDRVAALIRNAADSEKRAKILELTQKLLVQFRTLYVYQQTEKLIFDAEHRATKKVALISEGVKKGLLSHGEEKLFEGEKYRLQAQGKSIATKIASLQSELSKAIALPCNIQTSAQEAASDIPAENVLLKISQSSALSEKTRLNLVAAIAKEESRLSELDAFPQITPRLIYEHTNDGGDFFGAGISMPLPFWNRNQGERLRAKAEKNLAETRREFFTQGGLEAQIANLRRAAVSANEQQELFFSKAIPAFEAALQAQEQQYSEGKGNILQVWQTLRAFNEVQTQGLLLWLEAASARVQLSLLIGEEV